MRLGVPAGALVQGVFGPLRDRLIGIGDEAVPRLERGVDIGDAVSVAPVGEFQRVDADRQVDQEVAGPRDPGHHCREGLRIEVTLQIGEARLPEWRQHRRFGDPVDDDKLPGGARHPVDQQGQRALADRAVADDDNPSGRHSFRRPRYREYTVPLP